jgi:acyl dehydratase
MKPRGRHYDEFGLGEVFDSPFGITVSESEIIRFGMMYDPQPFHLDANAAAKNDVFGGLVASGFHTLAISFRLFIMTGVLEGTAIGGRGIDELRWLLPVRPGDTLTVRATVVEKVASSRGDRGTVKMRVDTFNQRGETVQTGVLLAIVAAKPPV